MITIEMTEEQAALVYATMLSLRDEEREASERLASMTIPQGSARTHDYFIAAADVRGENATNAHGAAMAVGRSIRMRAVR
jgi:hypothetical protein